MSAVQVIHVQAAVAAAAPAIVPAAPDAAQ